MNWEALGAVGELVGASAVVLTLLYLSRQIAAQSRALQTTTRDSVFRQMQEYNHIVMGDPRLGGLFQRAMATSDWSKFSEDDRARLLHTFFGFFKVYENIFLHVVDGSVSEAMWAPNREVLFAYAGQPGGRFYWTSRRSVFDPRFLSVLESIQGSELESGVKLLGIEVDGDEISDASGAPRTA